MTEDEAKATLREALERAASALEAADEATYAVQKLREQFDRFTHDLPSVLQELGVLTLSRDQYAYLLNQIAVGLAKEILARQKAPSAMLERKWAVRAAVVTAVTAVLGILILIFETTFQLLVVRPHP